MIESHCNYFAPLAFPEPVELGLRVGALGTSSVRYELGVFAAGRESTAAHGHFVHVYVDAETRRPVLLPARLREVLEALRGQGGPGWAPPFRFLEPIRKLY